MEQMLALDASSPYYKGLLEVFRQFKDQINSALSYMSRAKKVQQNQNIAKRNVEVCQVKVDKLYDWAVDILVNLKPTDKKTLWGDVAIALMLVTGRRQAEIFSSAVFEVSSENTVFFLGQLKTKGKNERASAGYDIPVLAPPSSVVDALKWLEEKGKRAETPELAHKRFSPKIVPFFQVPQELYEVVARPPIDEQAAKGERLTSHLCRQIYGQVAASRFKPNHMTRSAYIASILGHSEGDLDTIKSYTADIEVVEA
jgi:hypothetical protein